MLLGSKPIISLFSETDKVPGLLTVKRQEQVGAATDMNGNSFVVRANEVCIQLLLCI